MALHKAAMVALAVVGLTLPAAGIAHAAEEASKADIAGLLRHLFNLAILFGFLGWALRKPLSDFLQRRQLEVKEALDESWHAKATAEERYTEIEARISNFEGELENLMSDVRSDAATERKAIEARAELAASQLDAASERSVAEELRRARRELRDEAIGLAVGLASDLLGNSVGSDDQERLTQDYLGTVGEAAGR
jgi:F-type H+-transporting ATPase subunit b